MSKEYLEAFKNLKQELYYSPNQIPDIDKWHEIIDEALQRLEAIDNSNLSEVSFIWLNQRIIRLEDDLQHYIMVEKDKALASITEKELNHLTAIKQALLKAQEQEKVLSIIKKKCLYNDNLNYVAVCINYDMYKEKMSKKHDTVVVKTNWNDKVLLDCLKLLTQEEFELLKRWLG